ncbi:MAG TPA: alginate lyase family protein, partial [Candidatus Baltobacteraceae bacterium]
AANDGDLWEWGIAKFAIAAEQITQEGILRLEMERAARALHYHLFALTPLIFLAELGAASGEDLYGAHDGALHRLVNRCVGVSAQ